MIWIIPLVILIFFEMIADIFAKEWSLGRRGLVFAILALLGYLLANTSWLIALKNGSGLARGAVVFSVASALLATLIGLILYHERLTAIQTAGVLLGLVSLVLIFWP